MGELRPGPEVREPDRFDFAVVCLIARAEEAGMPAALSFDPSIDGVQTVTRRRGRWRRDGEAWPLGGWASHVASRGCKRSCTNLRKVDIFARSR